MGRKPCCSKEGLNRGSWTAMEDEILVSYINKHGEGKWGSLPKRAGLKRCGKSCRLRWLNYLRPGIKRGNISDDEEELIVRLHRLLGNRWSLIAGRLPGRTDNEIKNYWNTTLGKKLQGNSNSSSCSNYQAIAPSKRRPKLQASSDAGVARRRSPAPDTSPIRTKARRCTRVLAAAPTTTSQDRAPESVADHDDREGETAVEDAAAGQQDYLSFGSIDLDFESIELSFLSPWRGDAAELTDVVLGATGDHQFGVGEAEVDLEELLGLGAGDDAGDQGVPSLGTWISCHGFHSS